MNLMKSKILPAYDGTRKKELEIMAQKFADKYFYKNKYTIKIEKYQRRINIYFGIFIAASVIPLIVKLIIAIGHM